MTSVPASRTLDERPRVLFVDDEEDLLLGLRSSTRRHRKRFDFDFANSGVEALGKLEEQHFDVVVSDMRMPGMNGVELLTEIARRHPHVVRIVLSGEAGSDLLLNAVHATHQWLSKPCEVDVLTEALDNAVRYRSVLHHQGVLRAVSEMDVLPSPPLLYGRLMEVATSPDASVGRIADLVKEDPAAIAKVLQLANSAFAAGGHVADIETAIVRIGTTNLSKLLLATSLLEEWPSDCTIPGMPRDTCVELAQRSARFASECAEANVSAEAAIAAMLHPVGLMIMARTLPEMLLACAELAAEGEIGLDEATRRLHGFHPPLLAAHVLSVWGLPTDVVLAVAHSGDEPAAATEPFGLDDAVRVGVRRARDELSGLIEPIHHLPSLDRRSAA